MYVKKIEGEKSDDVCIAKLTLGNLEEKEGKSVRKRKTSLDDISSLSERGPKIVTFFPYKKEKKKDSYFFRKRKNGWVSLGTSIFRFLMSPFHKIL